MQANISNNKGLERSFIEKQLNKIPLEKLSKESEFSKRKAKKITAKNFLLGYFLMFSSRGNRSYRSWASKIGLLLKDNVSKQALWKKMHEGQIVFLKKVLSYVMKVALVRSIPLKLKKFTNIIIEDGTPIRLNDKLHKEYPGNKNWDTAKEKAILKIQVAYNITKQKFIRFAISSFRENDQSYSSRIIDLLKKGDLLIRDLGYFVLPTFKSLQKRGIYFISRFRNGVKVFSRQDAGIIDLSKMLRKRGKLDIDVFVGVKERFPVRLIALPVKEEIVNQRRMKARTNRDKRCQPNKEHLHLLGWEIFITNVGRDMVTSDDIAKLYFIRWRIEIIFKSWKSQFRITDIVEDTNKIRVESYIYCMLIFITLFQVHFYNYCMEKAKFLVGNISLLSLMQYVTNNFTLLLQQDLLCHTIKEGLLMKQIIYYCRYEPRNDRTNFYQKLIKLS